ncbi:MAG: O-antigen ligase family protein, partial [bacterium]
LSALNAISYTMLAFGLYMLFKSYLVYLYIVNRVKTKQELNWLMLWLLVGLSFQGFLGIVQYTTGSSLGLEFLGAQAKTRLAGVTRVRGTIGYPNQFGAWLALLIPMASSLFILEVKSKKKLLYALVTFLGVMGLLLSFSRSAWAGLIGSSGIFIILLAIKGLLRARYVLTIMVVLIAVTALIVGFWDTIMLRFETGATGKFRLIMVDIAADIIRDNLMVGVGLMNYKFHSIEHFRFWHPVHNTYLRLAAETGIPGLLFFLTLVGVSMREAYAMLRCKDRYLFSVALGSLCSIWAFLFLVNFGPEYQHYRIKFLFWLVIGVIFSLRRIYKNELEAKKRLMQQPQKITTIPTVPNQTQAPFYPQAHGGRR